MPIDDKETNTTNSEGSTDNNEDIEQVFWNKNKNFRLYLCKLFIKIKAEFKNKEDKKLIFSKDFLKYLRNDSKTISSLTENSKNKRRFVWQYISESIWFIKKKLKEYKERRKKTAEEISRIGEIFWDIAIDSNKNKNDFISNLYLLFYNIKEINQSIINEDVIFGNEFLKYIHDNTHIIRFIIEKTKYYKDKRKNNRSKSFWNDVDLNNHIIDEYKNFTWLNRVISDEKIKEEMDNIDTTTDKQATKKENNLKKNLNKENLEDLEDEINWGFKQNSNTWDSNKNNKEINRSEDILKAIADKIRSNDSYKSIKKLIETKWGIDIKDEYIVAYYMSTGIEKYKIPNKEIKDKILENSRIVSDYLEKNFKYDIIFQKKESENFSSEKINEIILRVNQSIKKSSEIWINNSNFEEFKSNIFSLIWDTENIRNLLEDSNSWVDYITQKMDNYLISSAVDSNNNWEKWVAMLYATIIKPPIDIQSFDDINIFIRTIKWEVTKYSSSFNNFIDKRKERDYEWKYNYATKSLINRYERAQELAETKKIYESDFINISKTNSDSNDQSWIQIASQINNIEDKLNHYKIKSDKTEHEDAALRYTAFDITFNNAFNLDNPTIQKIANQKIDLRSELSNYWIYNNDNNSFNKSARDKFVFEKLQSSWLTPEEIETLWKTMEWLPSEIEKNYKILCGNFDADKNSFEKIAKIYALGEVIDKIKSLFSNINSKKLWNFMGIELDENEPANVMNDCLFLKWKINWSEINIKYDLRTWKLYMNSFTEQTSNPPMIVVWNTKPNREIWDLGSFENTISNMDSIFHIQNDDENTKGLWDNYLWNSSKDGKDSKQNQEMLIKKKLTNDLGNIWKIVKEKAWEQGKENNVIDDLLKTFNILPDYWELKDVEFMWWSKLFILLESIKNTDNEEDLLKFSNQMKELMSMCELSRWKNNEAPQKSEFSSVTIFDINENNAATDIISLQKANKKFFLNESWEKEKLKSSKSHFDSSVQLSFADIIVQKCCKNTWDWRKISTIEMETFINSIKYGISDGKDLVACEELLNDDCYFD